jgi:hypothetical protein
MDELFASGIKLEYTPEFSYLFEIGEETEVINIHRNLATCPADWVCLDWAIYQKNISVILPDITADFKYAIGDTVGVNSKPLLCKLEDGVVSTASLTMLMLHGDPLMRRVNDVIDRVVEAGLYNYWISLEINLRKIIFSEIAIVRPLDDFYSFNLYHLQTVFYLLLMGWCLSVLCCIFEVLYNRVLNKIL